MKWREDTKIRKTTKRGDKKHCPKNKLGEHDYVQRLDTDLDHRLAEWHDSWWSGKECRSLTYVCSFCKRHKWKFESRYKEVVDSEDSTAI